VIAPPGASTHVVTGRVLRDSPPFSVQRLSLGSPRIHPSTALRFISARHRVVEQKTRQRDAAIVASNGSSPDLVAPKPFEQERTQQGRDRGRASGPST